MQFNSLGSTGVKLSQLCLGTMTFGNEADASTSAALYRRCREAGINAFDCANVYVGGESEKILGRLIKDERQEVFIASKVGSQSHPQDLTLSRDTIVAEMEASLRRLGTDYLDLYYCHRFNATVPMEESLAAMDELVRAGKTRYIGVSNWAAWQVAKGLGLSALHQWQAIQVMQPMYSLVKRQAEAEILPLAQDAGLAVMNYSPLGGGLLSGKYGQSAAEGNGRLQDNNMYNRRYQADWMFEAASGLAQIADELGVHCATLAIAWSNYHPGISQTLIGARSLEQLEPSLAAAEFSMDDSLYQRIADLTPPAPVATDRTEE